MKDTMRRKTCCFERRQGATASPRGAISRIRMRVGQERADPAQLLCPGPRAACCIAYREMR
jgi:hypothetical protein